MLLQQVEAVVRRGEVGHHRGKMDVGQGDSVAHQKTVPAGQAFERFKNAWRCRQSLSVFRRIGGTADPRRHHAVGKNLPDQRLLINQGLEGAPSLKYHILFVKCLPLPQPDC